MLNWQAGDEERKAKIKPFLSSRKIFVNNASPFIDANCTKHQRMYLTLYMEETNRIAASRSLKSFQHKEHKEKEFVCVIKASHCVSCALAGEDGMKETRHPNQKFNCRSCIHSRFEYNPIREKYLVYSIRCDLIWWQYVWWPILKKINYVTIWFFWCAAHGTIVTKGKNIFLLKIDLYESAYAATI